MGDYKKIIIGGICSSVFLFSGCMNSDTQNEIQEIEKVDTKSIILKSVSATEFKSFTDKITKNDTQNIILDMRTLEEFNAGHIENAIMLDFYKQDFTQKLSQLDKSKTYFIYCSSGNRTGQALKIMKKLEFTNVYNLKYGINDWNKNKFLVVE